MTVRQQSGDNRKFSSGTFKNREDRRLQEKEDRKRAKLEGLPLDARIKRALGDKPTNLGKAVTSAQRKKQNRKGMKHR